MYIYLGVFLSSHLLQGHYVSQTEKENEIRNVTTNEASLCIKCSFFVVVVVFNRVLFISCSRPFKIQSRLTHSTSSATLTNSISLHIEQHVAASFLVAPVKSIGPELRFNGIFAGSSLCKPLDLSSPVKRPPSDSHLFHVFRFTPHGSLQKVLLHFCSLVSSHYIPGAQKFSMSRVFASSLSSQSQRAVSMSPLCSGSLTLPQGTVCSNWCRIRTLLPFSFSWFT